MSSGSGGRGLGPWWAGLVGVIGWLMFPAMKVAGIDLLDEVLRGHRAIRESIRSISAELEMVTHQRSHPNTPMVTREKFLRWGNGHRIQNDPPRGSVSIRWLHGSEGKPPDRSKKRVTADKFTRRDAMMRTVWAAAGQELTLDGGPIPLDELVSRVTSTPRTSRVREEGQRFIRLRVDAEESIVGGTMGSPPCVSKFGSIATGAIWWTGIPSIGGSP